LQVHLILDDYSTHKHAGVLDQVERWFRDLTDKNLHRGVFASVPNLIASIEASLNADNADPKPYVWTATADPSSPKSNAHAHQTSTSSELKMRQPLGKT
jgi:hypothetical protein